MEDKDINDRNCRANVAFESIEIILRYLITALFLTICLPPILLVVANIILFVQLNNVMKVRSALGVRGQQGMTST